MDDLVCCWCGTRWKSTALDAWGFDAEFAGWSRDWWGDTYCGACALLVVAPAEEVLT